MESKKKFSIGTQAEAIDFMVWLLNQLHLWVIFPLSSSRLLSSRLSHSDPMCVVGWVEPGSPRARSSMRPFKDKWKSPLWLARKSWCLLLIKTRARLVTTTTPLEGMGTPLARNLLRRINPETSRDTTPPPRRQCQLWIRCRRMKTVVWEWKKDGSKNKSWHRSYFWVSISRQHLFSRYSHRCICISAPLSFSWLLLLL